MKNILSSSWLQYSIKIFLKIQTPSALGEDKYFHIHFVPLSMSNDGFATLDAKNTIFKYAHFQPNVFVIENNLFVIGGVHFVEFWLCGVNLFVFVCVVKLLKLLTFSSFSSFPFFRVSSSSLDL